MYSKQQGVAMVKYQKKSIDHGYRTFTQSKNLCMVDWFEDLRLIELLTMKLKVWVRIPEKSALVSQIYLVQQDEEHGHYFFYNDEMKKRKRKWTLVNLKMKHHSSNFSPKKYPDILAIYYQALVLMTLFFGYTGTEW